MENIYQIISDENINTSGVTAVYGWAFSSINAQDHPAQFPYMSYGVNIQAIGTWHHDYRPTRMLLTFRLWTSIVKAALIDAEGEIVGLFEPYESNWTAEPGNVTIAIPLSWGSADLSRLYISTWYCGMYLRRIDFDFRESGDPNTEWGSIIWTPAGGYL